MQDGGGLGWLVAIGLVVWVAFFDGSTTIRGWLGQNTYENMVASLENHARRGRIGHSADVWLVKNTFIPGEKVALFFGYWDDWDACYEFLTSHKARFPADSYSCSFAN